jgi:hypothetical protein
LCAPAFEISSSFDPITSLDPFADIRRAILDLNVIRFAIREELDCILVYQGDILQIESEMAAGRFHLEESLQLCDVFCLNTATECEDDFPVRGSLDLQHIYFSDDVLPLSSKQSVSQC